MIQLSGQVPLSLDDRRYDSGMSVSLPSVGL